MADNITAKAEFEAHPEGQFVGVCVDVIDLGGKVIRFKDEDPYIAHRCALVFATGARNKLGKLITVQKEMTVSVSPKGNMRPFLESWRGKKYDSAQLRQDGIPLHKLQGQPALLSIEQNESADGSRVYGNIASISPLPAAMKGEIPNLSEYERGAFWGATKSKYADEVAKFKTSMEDEDAKMIAASRAKYGDSGMNEEPPHPADGFVTPPPDEEAVPF